MDNKLRVKKWIEISKILEENPDAYVICPKCNIGKLKVITVQVSDSKKQDKYITCTNCKETFLMTGYSD